MITLRSNRINCRIHFNKTIHFCFNELPIPVVDKKMMPPYVSSHAADHKLFISVFLLLKNYFTHTEKTKYLMIGMEIQIHLPEHITEKNNSVSHLFL
jgi:hypothetical protein